MRHLFIIDPLAGLNPRADTSVVFMREAAKRGHSVATCEVAELSISASGTPEARYVETLPAAGDSWYQLGARGSAPLGDFDVVWQRKDPPYDLDYFFVTHLLSLAPESTLVVNDPRGLREVTEKLFVLRYPDLCPETLISKDIAQLEAYRETLGGEMIIKPLDGCGGAGVFHLTPDDRNVRVILETATAHGSVYQIAQRYLPEVRQGDKRIILIEGEPVGAVLRVPTSTESRSNFHVGGTAQKAEISPRDREICERLRPDLLEYGILFAGIDVIGRWLTEVNVTSPTGVQEINQLDGVALEAQVLDAVEARFARR